MVVSWAGESMNIVRVRFRTNDEFEAHYQNELPNGGLFCPTTTRMQEGDDVVVELSLPALPNKVLIRSKVISWRPALPRLRVRAGAVVEFLAEEAHKRAFVLETLDGRRVPSHKRRHTRLPVDIEARYRFPEKSGYEDVRLVEISVGGALLATPEPLAIDTDLILELLPPGAVSPISIASKVGYHGANNTSGVKFLYRDAGGTRRLRELIRRLREA